MCQMLQRANRRSNSTWLRIVILSVHIRASLWSPWRRGSWTSSSIGPVAQHVIKDLGSFCLSIHCHRVNFIPRLVPCACEMADSGSPGYCTVTRFVMRGREPGPLWASRTSEKICFPRWHSPYFAWNSSWPWHRASPQGMVAGLAPRRVVATGALKILHHHPNILILERSPSGTDLVIHCPQVGFWITNVI